VGSSWKRRRGVSRSPAQKGGPGCVIGTKLRFAIRSGSRLPRGLRGSCIEKRGRSPRGAAPTASCRLLVCGVAAFMLATRPAGAASDATPSAECGEPFDVRIWWSPRKPIADLRWRLIAVADREPASGLVALDPAGRTVPLEVVGQSGPPWSLVATIERPPSGSWRIEARRGDRLVAPQARAREPGVAAARRPPEGAPGGRRGLGPRQRGHVFRVDQPSLRCAGGREPGLSVARARAAGSKPKPASQLPRPWGG